MRCTVFFRRDKTEDAVPPQARSIEQVQTEEVSADLTGQFQCAGGTVIGREHRLAGKNGHDAFCIAVTPTAVIAVVTDGCGSGSHSEVGAKLGAQLLLRSAQGFLHVLDDQKLSHDPSLLGEAFWLCVQKDVASRLYLLADSLPGNQVAAINDYFLFSTMAALITPQHSYVVSFGDGVYAVNGVVSVVGPYPGNAPPYLMYSMLRSSLMQQDPSQLKFQIRQYLPTYELESLLLGSDGVVDLINEQDATLPGKEELVGPLSQFWSSDRYFKNPDIVRRRLTLINRDASQSGTEGRIHTVGRLPDDTTLAVVRRTCLREES